MKENKGVAWYDVSGSGPVRDVLVLLHLPYTLWHLSYVVIGAALAPALSWALLGWTVLAFFLGMGIGGHCLDELNGRPLRTTLPTWLLGMIAGFSTGLAIAIGTLIAIDHTVLVFPYIIVGAFLVVAYNLEWGNGLFHQDPWFGFSWGVLPMLAAYVAQAHTLSWSVVLLAVFAYCSSMAQRKLSLHSRFWRRKALGIAGKYALQAEDDHKTTYPVTTSGKVIYVRDYPINKETLVKPVDLALKYFNAAVVIAAAALLIYRWLG